MIEWKNLTMVGSGGVNPGVEPMKRKKEIPMRKKVRSQGNDWFERSEHR